MGDDETLTRVSFCQGARFCLNHQHHWFFFLAQPTINIMIGFNLSTVYLTSWAIWALHSMLAPLVVFAFHPFQITPCTNFDVNPNSSELPVGRKFVMTDKFAKAVTAKLWDMIALIPNMPSVYLRTARQHSRLSRTHRSLPICVKA